jgi:lipopolysaccharide transport system ATP-binding protein
MSDISIRVEGIGKQFRLGQNRQGYKTIRESIGAYGSSLRNLFSRNRHADRGSNGDRGLFWALRGLTFEINRGEVLGIVGTNGAGKSTLLKILSRVTEPTCGWAEIHGRLGSLLEVGTGFHPELTGRENIFLNGCLLGMTRMEIRRKFDAIVAFADLEQFLDTPVKRYSSGMYMRLAFAIAAHLEPDILIVDEVLAVGDARFQKKCIGKMQEVAQDGRTVILVSHNVAVLQSLCTRGILLSNGNCLYDGSITNAVRHHIGSLESASAQDLRSRKDRKGTGEIKLEEVEITPAEGTVLATGSPARFAFKLSRFSPATSFSFTIHDSLTAPIAHFTPQVGSDDDGTYNTQSPSLICRIPEMPLLPGRYYISTAVHSSGDLQDWLANAVSFDVEPGVYKGRPIPAAGLFGNISIPHIWTVPSTIVTASPDLGNYSRV